jgi:uncharacterized protein YggT (Ycf19 family)
MSLIDAILNFAGLLLWFNWRSIRMDPLARRRPATLAGTLKSTRHGTAAGWPFLAALTVLLAVRAVIYWQLGASVDWLPRLDMGLVVLAFPIDGLTNALLFSAVSFLRLGVVAFFWLLVIGILTRRVEEPDPILKLVRIQLGRIWRLPVWAQLAITPVLTICLWAALRPVLSGAGVVGEGQSSLQVLQQGVLLFGALVASLKLLLPLILLLYMLSIYVYLGNNPVWAFVTSVSRGLLAPFRREKLRSSKLDFAPLAGILVILLLLHTLPMLGMRFAVSQNLTVWPG